ncbi:MAG: hypothetical protein ACTHXJ_02345, partial [Mesonia sp.]
MTSAIKAQVYEGDFTEKKLAVSDTIAIDSVSINPFKFKVYNSQKKLIDSTAYQVDFSKSYLILNDSLRKQYDSIKVVYRKYPDYFTKRYYQFDPNIIVGNENRVNRIYQLGEEKNQRSFVPFDGLTTSGSISRGITMGTNQNAVLDSELDLQITGKISDNVNLRASLQDSNIPIQQSGYSQNLNEFDQIFIELYGKNWSIRA